MCTFRPSGWRRLSGLAALPARCWGRSAFMSGSRIGLQRLPERGDANAGVDCAPDPERDDSSGGRSQQESSDEGQGPAAQAQQSAPDGGIGAPHQSPFAAPRPPPPLGALMVLLQVMWSSCPLDICNTPYRTLCTCCSNSDQLMHVPFKLLSWNGHLSQHPALPKNTSMALPCQHHQIS